MKFTSKSRRRTDLRSKVNRHQILVSHNAEGKKNVTYTAFFSNANSSTNSAEISALLRLFAEMAK